MLLALRTETLTISVKLIRLQDQQRMQLKMLEDQARDHYAQQVRDMTTAAAATNMQQLGTKQSHEAHMRRYEAERD